MGMHHLRAINQQENCSVVALVDPVVNREDLGELIAATTNLYKSPEEMFAAEQPDVVHIVTPPDSHASLALLSLENDASIYVEKPFALVAKEAAEVLALAKQKKLKVCAAHQVLFQPAGQKYQTYMEFIKKIIHIESYFSFKTVRGSISPVNQILDILPHPVYLMLNAFRYAEGSEGKPDIEMIANYVDPLGEIRVIFRSGSTTGLLIVSLNGRPVESYLRVVGSNGSINADFVLSGVSKHLGPGASAIAAVLQPFSLAFSKIFGTISSILKILLKKHKSYAGLAEVLEKFYTSIRNDSNSPVEDEDIFETVAICEKIGKELEKADKKAQSISRQALEAAESELVPVDPAKKTAVVTGGTGFLGKVVVKKLREAEWPVRVLCRNIPNDSNRIAGIEYVRADIGEQVPAECFSDAGIVVHLAAETAGGQAAHQKNTIQATENMIRVAHEAGVSQFINISSVAVMKPGTSTTGPLNENSPVDADNLGRGPYVWGKARAEEIAHQLGKEFDMQVNTIRLGPLVDYDNYMPPGRLGREVGTLFVAMGSKKSKLSLCDLDTAADVIRSYLDEPKSAPRLLNLVDPNAPTRKELLDRHLGNRRELSVFWMPNFLLKAISVSLKFMLKLLKPGKKPLDVYAAFSAEKYDAALAAEVIRKARNQTA